MRPANPTLVGVVASARLLFAAGLAGGGRSIRLARTDDGRRLLLDSVLSAGAPAIVVAESLSRGDPLVPWAVDKGLIVWVASAPLVDTISRAADLRSPGRIAAAIAQLPSIPFSRSQLRRLVPDHDRRQLTLL